MQSHYFLNGQRAALRGRPCAQVGRPKEAALDSPLLDFHDDDAMTFISA